MSAATPSSPSPSPSPAEFTAAFVVSRIEHLSSALSTSADGKVDDANKQQYLTQFKESLPHLFVENPPSLLLSSPPSSSPPPLPLGSYIDHTLLKCDGTSSEVHQLVSEALTHAFKAICVNSDRVADVKKFIGDAPSPSSPPLIAAVVGFPLGASLPSVKAFESSESVRVGANEIDMVINVGKLKDGRVEDVFGDIRGVVEAARESHRKHHSHSHTHHPPAVVKVIIESSLLNDPILITDACLLSCLAKAEFVKTSTGFHSTGGAKAEHVRMMKYVVGKNFKVKASGGIRSTEAAIQMIACGAERLGTSSGVDIVKGKEGKSAY